MQRVGTAGWSLPAGTKGEGSHLFRYSRVLPCAEINSSFHRSHRASTWARWAAETPDEFRFSIKAPKTITHEAKLQATESLFRAFLEQIEPLGAKAGPVLLQLPPSLGFEELVAQEFLPMVRTLYTGELALEPRHASWLTAAADALLVAHRVARVAADPAKGGEEAGRPGGDRSLVYYRLHGAPRTYYSSYDEEFLDSLASKVAGCENAWVIFDNTALAQAYGNALSLRSRMTGGL
ncbi:MAG TPA: DUF72 domain-containing protein [Acidobacteriaceae bacterium]